MEVVGMVKLKNPSLAICVSKKILLSLFEIIIASVLILNS